MYEIDQNVKKKEAHFVYVLLLFSFTFVLDFDSNSSRLLNSKIMLADEK